MLPSRRYLALLLLCLPFALKAQDANEELITWNPGAKLTWADYKGSPNPSSGAAASTTTYLGLEYNVRNNSVDYKILCRFSRNRSWGIHKTDYILGHEQGHFDIAELYARKLHKEMSEYVFNSKTFKNDLKKIYEGVMKEKEDMQNRYDNETNHSINKAQQIAWQKKIGSMLDEYQAYKDYESKSNYTAMSK